MVKDGKTVRHVFILNPKAGKKQTALNLVPQIEAFFKRYPMEYTVHITTAKGEATAFVKEQAALGDPVRFYACGGDGTMQEVASGMAGAPQAELACIPCGSANDFIRLFPHKQRFYELSSQIMGTAVPMDAIRCNGSLSLNLCSMGMDAEVATRMSKYKHLPFVSGPMAYQLAVARTFLGKLGQPLRVVMETTDGIVERRDRYLFALAANGQYYGGGYHGSPQSVPDDGLLDFVLVRKLSHFNVLRFLGTYKRGEHLSLPCCETFRGTAMKVYADTPASVNADGECFRDTSVEFSLLPQAISFVMPAENTEELLKNYEMSGKCAVTP